jgi:hypothetical protein
MPFAQGLSKHVELDGKIKTMGGQCIGFEGGGGSGGNGGAPDVGGAPPAGYCPSSYVAEQPTFETADNIPILVATLPVLEPGDENGDTCAMTNAPISFGSIFQGDCTGDLVQVDLFTGDDLSTFFGNNTVLPPNTQLLINGGPVRLISGIALKTASVGGIVYAVSNVSNTLISYNIATQTRTDFDLGSLGVSGLMALPSGVLVFATMRTFTAGSWNGANNDPGNLVEAEPIHIQTFDPATQMITELASISGGSRVLAQNSTPASADSYFLAGTTNAIALAQDGSILVSDRLAGKVYKVAIDGSTVTELFTTPGNVLLSSLVEAPNNIIYVVKSATANHNCDTILTRPTIAYWDENALALVDWFDLGEGDIYADVLNAVSITGVLERNLGIDRTFLGAGLHVDLTYDNQANLIVATSLTGVTQAVPVLPSAPPPGDGGGGAGSGGASAGGSGGIGGTP